MRRGKAALLDDGVINRERTAAAYLDDGVITRERTAAALLDYGFVGRAQPLHRLEHPLDVCARWGGACGRGRG